MKRTYRFVEAAGTVVCATEDGESVELPVFLGLLKHPDLEQLVGLLRDPAVARKYTHVALRKGPWSMVRQFPRHWLLARLQEATLPEGRRRALEFMLGEDVTLPRAGPAQHPAELVEAKTVSLEEAEARVMRRLASVS